MVNEVNKIIYNRLITEREITLPGVGSLSLVRHAASMSSREVIVAPRLTIEFSSRTTRGSVVDAIATIGCIDTATAEDIYSRWLEKVRSGSTLTIEGVGILRNKSFEADKELLSMLNGTSATHVNVVRRKKGRTMLWVGLVLSIIALIVSIAAIFNIDISAISDKTTNSDKQVETTVENIIVEPVAEDVATGELSTDVEEDIHTQDVVAVESIEVATVADSWTMCDDIRHWVVAGSYSTMSNAESAVETITKRHQDIDCRIITLGKMYAVAIYGSSYRDDCVQYMRKYHKNFGEAWIFTPKEYR
jgi:hypothetical protein